MLLYHTSGVTENNNKKLEPTKPSLHSVLLIRILLGVVITEYDREHFLHHVSLKFVQRLEDRRPHAIRQTAKFFGVRYTGFFCLFVCFFLFLKGVLSAVLSRCSFADTKQRLSF